MRDGLTCVIKASLWNLDLLASGKRRIELETKTRVLLEKESTAVGTGTEATVFLEFDDYDEGVEGDVVTSTFHPVEGTLGRTSGTKHHFPL